MFKMMNLGRMNLSLTKKSLISFLKIKVGLSEKRGHLQNDKNSNTYFSKPQNGSPIRKSGDFCSLLLARWNIKEKDSILLEKNLRKAMNNINDSYDQEERKPPDFIYPMH